MHYLNVHAPHRENPKASELARLLFTQNDRESAGTVETRPVVTMTEIRCATTLVKHSGNRRDTRIGNPLVTGSSPGIPTSLELTDIVDSPGFLS